MQPTLTITRVTEDNHTTKVVDSERLTGTSGSYSLSLRSVTAGNLKDTYQVVLSVENPGESPSTDSFPLYVYDADALKVQDDKGITISALTMDNKMCIRDRGGAFIGQQIFRKGGGFLDATADR